MIRRPPLKSKGPYHVGHCVVLLPIVPAHTHTQTDPPKHTHPQKVKHTQPNTHII